MCAAPSTPSIVRTCGHVRSIPRGTVQPWNSTISLFCAVAAEIASYHFIRAWPSDSMKSIFRPATPHDFHSGSLALRSSAVSRAEKLVHTQTPTLRAWAYFTRVGIQLALQPASTRMYSQPIFAAKSAARSCASRLLLLAPSDHQDHSERPGRIHDVSATFDGAARSVTRSLSVTVASVPTTMVRHGVVSVPGLVSCASGSVMRKRWEVPLRVTWDAP